MQPHLLHSTSLLHATTLELTCLSYELFFNELLTALHTKNPSQRKNHLRKAREVLAILGQGLNLEIPLAHNLLTLYLYVQGILVLSSPSNEQLHDVYRIMKPLAEGYYTLRGNEAITPHQTTGFQA